MAVLGGFGNLLLKHIAHRKACYVVKNGRFGMKAIPENSLVPPEYQNYVYWLFTVEDYSPLSGPVGLEFSTAYKSLDDLIDDGWAVD
jgi:hypothetical protein